ncbi:MAG: quinone-dependent dihydroorotate dehydrogenase [Alphaproteobacteria bacterium]|nr:quinone-dependent dihydroorotate dehydrogenase [Alphaproteobacteria bacterium]
MSSAGISAAAHRAAEKRSATGFDILKNGTALLRLLPPNLAHKSAVKALKYGLVPKSSGTDDPVLAIKLWDIDFPNPVGMSAGFDKNAEGVDGIIDIGFGFAEAGTVTPLPQPGNPKPNLFRLTEDRALINRLGFPSEGVDVFAKNLRKRHRDAPGILGINVGINTGTADAAGDVELCLQRLAQFASYVTINVSCPNTPGLCAWQAGDKLSEMVSRAKETLARASGRTPPLLVKIGPELDEEGLAAVADVALTQGIDGLIACNTTSERPATLRNANAHEIGGLSGPPIRQQVTKVLSNLFEMTGGKIPLVGCGGISSADDAYDRIRAGASLLQLYTALIYGGPGLVAEIKTGLAMRLRADGYSKVADAVGANHR